MMAPPERTLRMFLLGLYVVLVRPFLRLAAAFALAIGIAILISTIFAWRYRREALKVRFARQSSLEGLAIAYERSEPNASARRLESLAARLGVRLAPSNAKDRPSPPADLAAREKQLKDELRASLDGFIERSDDEPPRLAAGVREFLATHRADLAAVQLHALHEAIPLWEVRTDEVDAPLPSLLGFMTLVRLLCLQAVVDAEASCSPDERLEAAWRLNGALLKRPELVSLLIYRANDSLLHRLVRTLPGTSPEWAARLARFDPVSSLVVALRWEAPILVRDFYKGLAPSGGLFGSAVRGSAHPYLDMCGWEHALRMQALARRHETLNYCTLTPERLEELWRPSTPRWNILSKVAWPELGPAAVRMLRRRVDQELTALILLVRDGQLSSGEVASRACTGNFWTVSKGPAGTTIELARRVFDPVKKPLIRELSLRSVRRLVPVPGVTRQ
jgi:hypothetical protein